MQCIDSKAANSPFRKERVSFLFKVSKLNVTNSKATLCAVYGAFLKWQGKAWDKPKYRLTSPIPEFIPTEQEIDQLVAGCGRKIGVMLQVLKETGMRIVNV